MIGIVIVAHGGLAAEYLAAVEHVVGRKPGSALSPSSPTMTAPQRTAKSVAAADAVDQGDGVVVVTDMFGGSPSNLSLLACRRIIDGSSMAPTCRC